MTSLKEIIEASDIVAEVKKEPKIDAQGRSSATGKRKNSAARVWIKKGTGKVIINDRDGRTYLGREILFNIVNYPFVVTNNANKFDVMAT